MTELIQFLQDDKAIREERKKARKNRDKYTGVSSDEFSGSGFGPSKGRSHVGTLSSDFKVKHVCKWSNFVLHGSIFNYTVDIVRFNT